MSGVSVQAIAGELYRNTATQGWPEPYMYTVYDTVYDMMYLVIFLLKCVYRKYTIYTFFSMVWANPTVMHGCIKRTRGEI